MSEFKCESGSKVLVEAEVMDTRPDAYKVAIAGDREYPRWIKRVKIHLHPGVAVADLLKELEEVWAFASGGHDGLGSCADKSPLLAVARDLRAAREAAKKRPMSKPSLEERMRKNAATCRGVPGLAVNPDLVDEWADEVGALEKRVNVITSMTIEAAGAGIVESQEATIVKLEAALREIVDLNMTDPYDGTAGPVADNIARDALKENTNGQMKS